MDLTIKENPNNRPRKTLIRESQNIKKFIKHCPNNRDFLT